jgi:hypothetical protein
MGTARASALNLFNPETPSRANVLLLFASAVEGIMSDTVVLLSLQQGQPTDFAKWDDGVIVEAMPCDAYSLPVKTFPRI